MRPSWRLPGCAPALWPQRIAPTVIPAVAAVRIPQPTAPHRHTSSHGAASHASTCSGPWIRNLCFVNNSPRHWQHLNMATTSNFRRAVPQAPHQNVIDSLRKTQLLEDSKAILPAGTDT